MVTALALMPLLGVVAASPSATAAAHTGRGQRVDPDRSIAVTLVLRMPGRRALDAFVAEQGRAARPVALTPLEIGERFGLPADRLDRLVDQIEAAGLYVTRRYDQRTLLHVEGPAWAMEQTFSTELVVETHDHVRHRKPTDAPTIPAEWSDAVSAVLGLDDRAAWAPLHEVASVPRQNTIGDDGKLGPLEPAQFRDAYGLDELHRDGLDGSGETVGVVALAALRGKEVRLWERNFGLGRGDVEEVVVRPAPPGPRKRRWRAEEAVEVAMDLQVVLAAAPKAKVLQYSTRNSIDALVRVINRAIADGRTRILSISYGLCEPFFDRAQLAVQDATFAAAEAAGINLFAASGDEGVYGCFRGSNPPDRRVAALWPASSAHAVSVGGTTLFHDDGRYREEQAWASPDSIGGAGGGISSFAPKPSWQQGPGVDNTFSTGNRQVPDVAGPADPASGLIFVTWFPKDREYVLAGAGGTSASAPFWAGTVALYQQRLAAAGGGELGDIKPLLYGIARDQAAYAGTIYDVTVGANDYVSATPGWDYITGLGSPRVAALAEALASRRNAGQ